MNMPNNKIVVLYAICLHFFPGSIFAINILEDQDVIWEASRNVFIKYAKQDAASFGVNDHPVDLQVEELRKALGSMRISQKGNADPEQEQKAVFTREQIETLSENLAKGLANARPDQDVIFSLVKTVGRLLGTRPKNLYVAGRAFYSDGKLNFIIGDYDRPGDEGFEAAYDPTHVGIVTYVFEHGRREKSSRIFDKASIKAPGVEYKQLNGKRRNDWLVIDLRLASEAVDLSISTQKAEEKAKKREEIKELMGTEEATAIGATAATPATETPTTAAPATSTATTPTPAATPGTQSFEERLTILKVLRDKGLITDEEYAMKRRQILNEL